MRINDLYHNLSAAIKNCDGDEFYIAPLQDLIDELRVDVILDKYDKVKGKLVDEGKWSGPAYWSNEVIAEELFKKGVAYRQKSGGNQIVLALINPQLGVFVDDMHRACVEWATTAVARGYGNFVVVGSSPAYFPRARGSEGDGVNTPHPKSPENPNVEDPDITDWELLEIARSEPAPTPDEVASGDRDGDGDFTVEMAFLDGATAQGETKYAHPATDLYHMMDWQKANTYWREYLRTIEPADDDELARYLADQFWGGDAGPAAMQALIYAVLTDLLVWSRDPDVHIRVKTTESGMVILTPFRWDKRLGTKSWQLSDREAFFVVAAMHGPLMRMR
jgi:hypothetical protein